MSGGGDKEKSNTNANSVRFPVLTIPYCKQGALRAGRYNGLSLVNWEDKLIMIRLG